VLGVVALWGALGFVPGFVALVRSGGKSIGSLALSMAAGVGGGALVPALGGKDLLGFGISLAAAALLGAAAAFLLARLAAD
jgi:hypothetical protein